MDRKKFITKSLFGLGGAAILPGLATSCKEEEFIGCTPSPEETAGPFPLRSPADVVRANIIGDRAGVALQVDITIQNVSQDCTPLAGVLVDIWQCDADGNYSEYSGQLDGDFTNTSFLRGRQTTDANGTVSFISLYPGWYPGRAPHIHVEVLTAAGVSLLITQIAFPEDISNTVYATSEYKGNFDTSNAQDGVFDRSLSGNMADAVTGNTTDGYRLTKTIKVEA